MKTNKHPLTQRQAQALVGALFGKAIAQQLIKEYAGVARKPYRANSWLNATFYVAAGGYRLSKHVHFDGEVEETPRASQTTFL